MDDKINIINELKRLKNAQNISNQELSNLSGVPIGTVNRILAGQTENPSYQTITMLMQALGADSINGAKVPKELSIATINHFDSEVAMLRDEIATRNKFIKALCFGLAALMAIFVFLFVFDITNPTVGWFQR